MLVDICEIWQKVLVRELAKSAYFRSASYESYNKTNVTWNDQIDIVKRKVSKCIGVLYKAKFILDQKGLKHIYCFFHS